MKLRESSLSSGWYPHNPLEISRFLSEWDTAEGPASKESGAYAAIAPHAGWRYSGKIAAAAMASMNRAVDTLVIIGGHLPAGYPPLFAMEDAVNTPLGIMKLNTHLRSALIKEIGGEEDRFPDNTVEVLLPMARFFFPDSVLLWVRLPAEMKSFEAGKAIAAARGMGFTMAVVASTDLTHYGAHFGFAPMGIGHEALRWMKGNDRHFIDAVISGDPAAVLERAEKDMSSCSAGAVLGAMGFAAAGNLGSAHLLEYGTSADDNPSADSYVGYAALSFRE
ncbi:MAG: AmmeMemoRadiSam system protein B [Treponema sp.]|jgi:AmmeMemoRadiSam system protein B|nr:AmmeMemoRadiSam system protein B [Treponema sp.]